MLLEHLINIQVKSKRLSNKRKGYNESKLEEVKQFIESTPNKQEWTEEDIQRRTETIASELTKYFTDCFNTL